MAVSLNVSKMEVYSTLDAMKEKATHKINRFSETAPIHIKDAVHAFADVAELTGCNAIASKMLGFNITNALRQEVEGNIMAGLMSLVIVGVVLMVISIILGSLEHPLMQAIPDNSSFVELRDSIPSNLTSALNIAVIIPIILAAVLILGVVYMLAYRGGGQ
jgi:hypothetical protein